MIHALRCGLIGALAFLVAGAIPASAQNRLRLSDTITLRDGVCWLTSDATDVEKPPEKTGPQRCTFSETPASALARVSVPGNPDETIVFEYAIAADGTITGKGREGLNQGAYSCTITGKTRPGTKHGGLPKAGAVIRVWELPSLP
jgi:hypothetical protein